MSDCKAGEAVLGAQAQRREDTVTDRQTQSSTSPQCHMTEGWRQREPTDGHTRETVVPRQDHSSLNSSMHSAQGQGAAHPESKQGLTARALYSYFKSNKP